MIEFTGSEPALGLSMTSMRNDFVNGPFKNREDDGRTFRVVANIGNYCKPIA